MSFPPSNPPQPTAPQQASTRPECPPPQPPLPAPPSGLPARRPGLRPATLALWRVWHPASHTSTATAWRTNGPRARFDPHPPGPPVDHPDGPAVWDGSLLFDTAVLEALARGPALVDLCTSWRGSLVAFDAPVLHDLTDAAACAALGADPALGDRTLDGVGYHITQAWARHLHVDADGLRYHSARHRGDHGGRYGINVGMWHPTGRGEVVAQHRLVDDTLWPHVAAVLDRVEVAVNLVAACPRCRA